MSTLLTLLHLCDSLFPLGGYAHSDGLEAATASGRVTKAEDLRSWLEANLSENLGRVEGPAVAMAWRAFKDRRLEALITLDTEVRALRPSSSARNASRAMGTRLLKTWQGIRPAHEVQALRELPAVPFTLPVAFGVVCAGADVAQRDTLEAFLYTRLAAAVSCAMRLMSIGQHEAHTLLSNFLAGVPSTAHGILERGEPPASFMPVFDADAMSHQYVHSRLFRS